MNSDSDREKDEQVVSSYSQPSVGDRPIEQYAIVHKRPCNNQLE